MWSKGGYADDGGWYSTVSSLDVATTTWINAVTTAGGTVSAGRQTVVDTLIKSLKGNSLFTKLDRLWLLAAENAQQANIDIINRATWTAIGSPTFAANTGYTGGFGIALNTNFAPSGGTTFTLNAASIGAYVITNRTASANVAAMGSNGVGGVNENVLQLNAFGSQNIFGINVGNSGLIAGATTSQGFWVASRTTSTLTTLYRNGSSIGTDASASGALDTNNLYILGLNNAGSVIQATSDQLSAALIGGGLTTTDDTNLSNAVNAYMTSLGINVY